MFSPEDACFETDLCEQQQVEVESINIAPINSDTELAETNLQQTLTDEAVLLINQCQQSAPADVSVVSVPEQITGFQIQQIDTEDYILPEVTQQSLVAVDQNLNAEALELINQCQSLEMTSSATTMLPDEHFPDAMVSDVGTQLQATEPIQVMSGNQANENVVQGNLSPLQPDKLVMQKNDSVEVPIVVNTNVGASHKSVIEIPIMIKSERSCNNESHINESADSGEGNGSKIVVQISIPQKSCSTHCHNESSKVCHTNIDAMKIEVKDEKEKVIKIKLHNTNDTSNE